MMAYRTVAKPRLEMIVEPETKVRFRYESEGGSHGGLMGKKSGDEKAYPTVKLIGYNGKKPIYVKVSLYTEDNEQHVLQLKGPEGCVSFLTEKLTKDNTATFTNIKILSKLQAEVHKILMEQKLSKLGGNLSKVVRKELEKKYDKEIKGRAKQILNSVTLCFEAFEEGKQSRLCEPLFSDVICNQKTAAKGDLRIHRMSKYAGTWKGGDEIILLCDKVQKDNIKIEFYEEDSSNVIWKEPALFTAADVHYQVAITFKTPQYKENTEKKVLVRLARGTDYSEPREFVYTPDFEEKPMKKRKLHDSEQSVNLSLPSQIMEINDSNESSNSYGADPISPSETEAEVNDDNNLDLGMDFDCEAFIRSLGVAMTEIDKINEAFPLPHEDLIEFDGAYSMDPERIYDPCLDVRSLQVDGVDGPLVIDKLLGDMAISNDTDSDADSNADSFNSKKSNAEKLLAERREKLKHKIYSFLTKRDDSGNTLLHLSVIDNKDITMLLKANRLADVDIINVQNIRQETALHIATKLNKAGIVRKLLKENSNPNLKNKDGNNCYHIASENNCLEIMRSLLSCAYVPQIDAFNYTGLSPLHLAIKNKSDGCFNLLKIKSANLSTKDKGRGRCLLHYAVEFWPPFLITLFKDKEILMLVNDQDFDGNTPLHLACSFENIEVVKQLLKAGADPFLKNFKQHSDNEENFGETAFDITTNPKILEVLEKPSSSISVLDEVITDLCKTLDLNDRWKCLAQYSVDEVFINSLQLSPSPTKALLDFIKKENKEDFIPNLKLLLKMAGLEEALMIFKQRNI